MRTVELSAESVTAMMIFLNNQGTAELDKAGLTSEQVDDFFDAYGAIKAEQEEIDLELQFKE